MEVSLRATLDGQRTVLLTHVGHVFPGATLPLYGIRCLLKYMFTDS